MAVEMFIFNGQQFTPAEYQFFQQEHPELFTPVTPEVALATGKQQKLQECRRLQASPSLELQPQ